MDAQEWRFNKTWSKGDEFKHGDKKVPIVAVMRMLHGKLNPNDERPVIPLAHGDPSSFCCFRPPVIAEDAVVESVRSCKFNGYVVGPGLLPARKAVADYISKDLSFQLSPDDVYLTVGCKQAITAIISSLACPGANILLPMPTFPMYDAAAALSGLEVRPYPLLPERGWEVDLDAVEALADANTAAIVIINPGNPCGSVYTYQHLEKVAETARKLNLLVIADEVYNHITFGSNPFIRMGVFSSRVPVLTLGSISKRWMVPGWRLGWLVATDPNSIIRHSVLWDRVQSFFGAGCDPPTFMQAAVPQIIEKTPDEFLSNIINLLRQNAHTIYEKLQEIPCITFPYKPEGSMFAMVKLNVSLLEDIEDDVDFCYRLAKEENVTVLPGTVTGLNNWLRVTFAVEPSVLDEGLERMKAFCERHTKRP